MATEAQCLICFETLLKDLSPRSARPEKDNAPAGQGIKPLSRKPLGLAEATKWLTLYKTGDKAKASEAAIQAGKVAQQAIPLFVTLDKDVSPKRSTKVKANTASEDEIQKELRGCIGTFETSEPLERSLVQYVRCSAFEDTRFEELTFGELNKLWVSVTLLTDFEECKSWDDWELGKHGIEISVTTSTGRPSRATFLPSVAPEQGWDKEETMAHLFRKAHVHGNWKNHKFTTRRYQGQKVQMFWDEYDEWRSWYDEQQEGKQPN